MMPEDVKYLITQDFNFEELSDYQQDNIWWRLSFCYGIKCSNCRFNGNCFAAIHECITYIKENHLLSQYFI